MSTTIRINQEDKLELDKLQAEIFLITGVKLSYPEILNLLMKVSRSTLKSHILDLVKSPQNINWDDAEEFIQDWGFSDSTDIDEVVYR